MQNHEFHGSVLREYDIRGVVGDTLSIADAYAIGRSFGTNLVRDGGTKVAVGYDGRLSSVDMAKSLVGGLNDAGITALRVGRGPTPMLYFSVYHLPADAGIMVTGSHNPPDYNGFKMMLGRRPFFGEQILNLGRMAREGDWAAGLGTVEDHDVRPAYLDKLAGAYTTDTPLSVAWDCGNGAAGDILPDLIARLPGHHIALNEVVDGSFPSHHPDPTVAANLVQLQEAVTDGKLDMGIGFDGDGDRFFAIDDRGKFVPGDFLTTLLA